MVLLADEKTLRFNITSIIFIYLCPIFALNGNSSSGTGYSAISKTTIYFIIIGVLILISLAIRYIFQKAIKQKINSFENSHTYLQNILDACTDGIIVHDSDTGSIIDINKSLAEMFGYSREEILKTRISTISQGEEPYTEARAMELFKKSKEHGPQKFIWLSKKKSGELFWTEINMQHAIIGDKGCFVEIIRDISERKQIEETLINNKTELKEIFDNTAYGIFIIDVDEDNNFRVNNMNRADEMITGVKTETVKGKQFREFLPIEVADLITTNYMRCVEKKDILVYEEDINLPTTGVKSAITTLVPMKNNEGRVYRIIGSTLDITERKIAEKALENEKERLAVTLRSIGDAVITTDTKGKILIINRIAEQMTEWTQEEAEDKEITEVFKIINQQTHKVHDNPVDKVINTGKIIELENNTVLISKSGKEMIIADSAAPIKNTKGETIGVVLVFRDMTEKYKIQETVQRTAKLNSLALLAGGIAHDFNNLLSGIYGSLELSNLKGKEDRRQEYITNALSTINRAKSLTQQLLTFSKGGVPIKKTSALFPFIQNTVQFALSGSNVLCQFEIQEGLWLADFDENQIGQVIENISINAQQSMPLGGMISLKAENVKIGNLHPSLEIGNYIKISIQDTGTGIPSDLLPKIFDPFFTTKAKGHGLGLATSYSIIAKHKGTIEVESEMGKGTSFFIYLPVSESELKDEEPESYIEHKGEGLFLIMDDEEIIQHTLSEIIKYMGYEVVCKNNGKEAVEFFIKERREGRKIRGMIFDLTIPGGMGGKEAVSFIREMDKTVPVFVSSGYSEDPVLADPESFGFTASIKKPFIHRDISKLLDKYLKEERL